jgi:Putative F0F1-ATPase subunit Ca2+/Mg2+ transporter
VSEFTKSVARSDDSVTDPLRENGGRAEPRAGAPSLYGGFGEALAQAFEFAIVPVLFGLAGIWLDGRLGIRPCLTVALAGFGVIGVSVRTYFAYKERVEREEEGKPWTRRHRR